MNKVHYSSDSTEWETPQYLFDYFNNLFDFTLDVCATPNNTKCKKFFTKEDNSLKQNWWDEICWMNPPYGKGIRDWVAKAYYEALHNNVTVVCLLPARTDTSWWHDYCMRAHVILIKGRIKFLKKYDEDTKTSFLLTACAPFPSAIVIFNRSCISLNKISPKVKALDLKIIKEKLYAKN